MKKKFSDLPNWKFDIDEVSANVYEIIGIDTTGEKISFKGYDLDEIIDQSRERAKEIDKNKRDESV